MSGLGLPEVVVGVAAYYLVDKVTNQGVRPTELGDPRVQTPRDVELRRIREDIDRQGFDPIFLERIKLVIRNRQLKPRITNPQDNVQTLAELLLCLKENPPERDPNRIPIPPAANSRSFVLRNRVRIYNTENNLQGPSMTSGPSAIVGTN